MHLQQSFPADFLMAKFTLLLFTHIPLIPLNLIMIPMIRSYLQFLKLSSWQQYLEGSSSLIDVITNHKNLEYFTTTKILTCHKVCWSEYLFQFNMVICFCPGKLGAKPDVLTKCWDVYHKGGNSNFILTNPSNLWPIFTQEQLLASLHATYFVTPIICSIIIMDITGCEKG